MESTDSSNGSQQPQLPPGFRFHPTDEELVVHYLKKKVASTPLPVAIIAEVDLYKFDPWELPARATFGEQEWYFFSPRERKYPNGARPNRAATSGYWKATGTDKPVMTSGGTQKVGVKKALVFYGGKPPKGIKTNWIMHEYRLTDNKAYTKSPSCDVGNKKASLRLDDWVLCRIYKKNITQRPMEDDSMNDMSIPSIPPPSIHPPSSQNPKMQTIKASSYISLLENDHQNLFEGMLSTDHHRGIDNGCISQLALSNSKPQLPMKRTLQSMYWNDESTVGDLLTKRFHGDQNNIEESGVRTDENSSIVTLLSQLPQTSSLHQQTYQQSPMEYQLQGFNWFS